MESRSRPRGEGRGRRTKAWVPISPGPYYAFAVIPTLPAPEGGEGENCLLGRLKVRVNPDPPRATLPTVWGGQGGDVQRPGSRSHQVRITRLRSSPPALPAKQGGGKLPVGAPFEPPSPQSGGETAPWGGFGGCLAQLEVIEQLGEALQDEQPVALDHLDDLEGPGPRVGDEDGAQAGIQGRVDVRPR